MSAIANILSCTLASPSIVLFTDDVAVASNMTLSPDRILPNGVARWVDRSGGVPAAFPSVTMGIRNPSQGNRNYKVTASVTKPTLETLGTSSQSGYLPGQKVGYSGIGRMEFVIPERMTLAERKTLYSIFVSLLATSIYANDSVPTSATGSPLQAMVQTLEAVY